MRNLLVSLLCLGLLPTAARAQPWAAPAWDGPAMSDVSCSADEVLPAGVFHRGVGWYELSLRSCPAPAVAVVAGVFDTAAEAQRSARSVDAELAPGYPWVVHTRAAGLSGNGIAVVLAQWASRDQGESWREEHAPAARLLDVLGRDAALARFHSDQGGRENEHFPLVVYVETATPAYSTRDVRAIVRAAEQVSLSGEERFTEMRRRTSGRRRRATALCRIPATSVFTSDGAYAVLRGRERVWSRSWQPVRCGRHTAWVPIEATQVSAVTWRHRDGAARTTQVTLVECDVPVLTTWRLGQRGRVDARSDRANCSGEP